MNSRWCFLKRKLWWLKSKNLGGEKDKWVIFSMSEFGKVLTGAGEGTSETEDSFRAGPRRGFLLQGVKFPDSTSWMCWKFTELPKITWQIIHSRSLSFHPAAKVGFFSCHARVHPWNIASTCRKASSHRKRWSSGNTKSKHYALFSFHEISKAVIDPYSELQQSRPHSSNTSRENVFSKSQHCISSIFQHSIFSLPIFYVSSSNIQYFLFQYSIFHQEFASH